MNEYDTLAALIKPIENIDGGCGTCIQSFIRAANWHLKNNESDYYLVIDEDDDSVSLQPWGAEIADAVKSEGERRYCMIANGFDPD